MEVSTSSNYTFIVTGDRALVANFLKNILSISTSNSLPNGGTTTGSGSVLCASNITIIATPNTTDVYTFVNWTTNDVVASTDATTHSR